jgi:hypothetical protein
MSADTSTEIATSLLQMVQADDDRLQRYHVSRLEGSRVTSTYRIKETRITTDNIMFATLDHNSNRGPFLIFPIDTKVEYPTGDFGKPEFSRQYSHNSWDHYRIHSY